MGGVGGNAHYIMNARISDHVIHHFSFLCSQSSEIFVLVRLHFVPSSLKYQIHVPMLAVVGGSSGVAVGLLEYRPTPRPGEVTPQGTDNYQATGTNTSLVDSRGRFHYHVRRQEVIIERKMPD